MDACLTRELNPYFAGGGTGMPSASPGGGDKAVSGAVGKGDGGVAWLTKVGTHFLFPPFICLISFQIGFGI